MTTTIDGRCHCGNLSFEITTELATKDIVARACDCSFCRTHVTRNWSDPEGSARITVRDAENLNRYQFGLRKADFYICKQCGGYAGAVMSDGDGTWSTLNLRLTELHGVAEQPASYGNEDGEGRIARRKRVWTPTTIEGLS